jgi:uncharacterized protein (DUF849 family)
MLNPLPRMACTFTAPLFLVAYGGKETPTDDEWRAYLELIRRHCLDGMVQIITTKGACPTREQRHRLEDVLAGRPVATAFVSDSKCEHALAALLATHSPRFKALRDDQVPEALAFLGIPASLTELVARELAGLRRKLERSPS